MLSALIRFLFCNWGLRLKFGVISVKLKLDAYCVKKEKTHKFMSFGILSPSIHKSFEILSSD